MMEKRAKRKLTAILSADVKGYSGLMEEDELGTVRTLEAYREMIAEVIRNYSGRVVDSPGDNLLAEFTSVVNAVESAVEIQNELKSKNAELPENRRMEFRIGINLGDVIEEGERIYGDGVNVAARIEGLAEGGGVCISRTAFDHVEGKLGLEFEYLGEQSVKNIKKPVRIYRVRMESSVSDVERSQELPLPDKPSIAVLPFVNMSGDPDQEYFSDGVAEEIITALSKTPKLFVIARNSSFTYKGKSVWIPTVSRELGVRYVLEGSVRKAGDKVRITAQLIDAKTNQHLWAERYDRNLNDIFAIQDEISMKIITAMEVKLTRGESARLYAKGTENLEAYLRVLQGREYYYRFNKEDNLRARKMCEEAIALDPEYPMPYLILGGTHFLDIYVGWSKSPRESMERAAELAQRCIALDDSFSPAHGLLSGVYLMQKQHDKAIFEAEKAVALDPNSADDNARLGNVLNFAGKPEEAILAFEKAIRLNPFPPSNYFHGLGMAYRETGQYEQAMTAAEKAIQKQPDNIYAYIVLASTCSLLNRKEQAHAASSEVLRIDPKFSLEALAKARPHIDPENTARFIKALRKAGLPD
jgi:adenylate cyclase